MTAQPMASPLYEANNHSGKHGSVEWGGGRGGRRSVGAWIHSQNISATSRNVAAALHAVCKVGHTHTQRGEKVHVDRKKHTRCNRWSG